MLLLLLVSASFFSHAQATQPLPTWSELMKELEPIGDKAADEVLIDPSVPQARMDFFYTG
jgi:hypothetical protein|tara:strand:+ start:164 stop:343 length:180 start_codon:yes stop_codon:yes gene_type:complete